MSAILSPERVGDLAVDVSPLGPDTTLNEVADRFLSEECRDLLSLPVVSDGRVLGTLSRYRIMRIFLQSFGREIYGKRPAWQFVNDSPMAVSADVDVEEAGSYLRQGMTHPITEDFVVLNGDGGYRGVGMVMSLLERLEQRAKHRTQALAVANRTLKSSQARLIQSEKMASLGQMVAGIAHEINTPLGYVQSNIELAGGLIERLNQALQASRALLDQLSRPDADDASLGESIRQADQQSIELGEHRVLEDLDAIVADSLHGLAQIGELVVSLRNFSRIDHGETDRACLNECLDAALTIGRNIIKQKADVIREYCTDAWVECAPARINQVLLNVLTNAAQAIETYGQIHVSTRARTHHVDIHIRDNGCGMSDAVRKRIFDPFYTTKPVGDGTGLGLSISYQIIRQHRGLIDVRSAPGKGTEFVIRLPRQQAATIRRSAA